MQKWNREAPTTTSVRAYPLYVQTADVASQCPAAQDIGNGAPISTDEWVKLRVDLWKTAIDVQKHFNDLEFRIRGMAVPVITAVASGAATAEGLGHRSIALWLLGLGLVSWMAFFAMDRYWYHPLLKGAVAHAQVIERSFGDDMIQFFGLSTRISAQSGGRSSARLLGFYVTIGVIVALPIAVAALSALRIL